ncbi:S24 family peptidase [Sedimenticola hydrogenitrophicus]|uniref:S24 family peptidase n=1 Tax=Sedimenticola hydrogenitrophicus TaxID=2967975 RepID=UPI0023B0CB97|nr:helix-turn-helix transcriptional regulator [Sedimenticola hydrogenitrophicus]
MRLEDLAAPKEASIGNQIKEHSEEYALVPLYDVRAAAGHGAVVEEEQIIDSLAFKRQWIQQELHASPGDLYLIYVDGESMEPTLRPGDVILVDRRSAQAVPRDGIYVLRMDGSLLVKRLQRLPGRQVKVTSDNPAYEPFNLSLEAPGEDLAIVGRVVWTGRRM